MGKIEKWILFAVGNFPIYIFIFIQNFDFSFFCKACKWMTNSGYRSKVSIPKYVLNNSLPFLCILLLAGSIILFKIFIKGQKTKGNHRLKIKKASSINENYLEMLNSYILPILVTSFSNLNATLSFLVVLLLNGYLYTKTELYHSNLFLALRGYNLFNVEGIRGNDSFTEEVEGVLLSKKRIKKDETIKIIYLNSTSSSAMTFMEVDD
ncbi:hypothetical protein [Candidatus Enterococcus murrayae]|uniref:Uncharacterized protein n=1 Tax=Candidatus Enterococcus murrayae TaxID=2815321 RepID=A0ABS3HNQ5_9ENTE|nr:hypothetical protein [Enterococcus sp. MJM16]MBO0454637.1 hypothetical protein [Enterococcus sp. MJM16]